MWRQNKYLTNLTFYFSNKCGPLYCGYIFHKPSMVCISIIILHSIWAISPIRQFECSYFFLAFVCLLIYCVSTKFLRYISPSLYFFSFSRYLFVSVLPLKYQSQMTNHTIFQNACMRSSMIQVGQFCAACCKNKYSCMLTL